MIKRVLSVVDLHYNSRYYELDTVKDQLSVYSVHILVSLRFPQMTQSLYVIDLTVQFEYMVHVTIQ